MNFEETIKFNRVEVTMLMEQAGYEFEKGKIRAQQEHQQQQFQAYYNSYEPETDYTSNNIELSPPIEFFITFFFGAAGVHKFIKGQIGMGVLYLFTCGLFGIGWLHDVIKSAIRLTQK